MDKLFYKTINEHSEYEIPKIKGSRFIGNVFHVNSKEDTERFIDEIQQKYPNARHHCFAYKYDVQMNFDIFGTPVYMSKYSKVSDAGEPASTAGKPIMNSIEKHNLHNILIVITRYFGGTLLGVGGLIQAYGDCAKQVIEHAKIVEAEITRTVHFQYPFELISTIKNLLNKYHAKTIKENYDKEAEVEIEISINSGYLEGFKKDLLENSKGLIKL